MAPRVSVLLPVAAPYREPLLATLHGHPQLELSVIYASSDQPSWDVPGGFFATSHPYPARHLRSLQIPRPGRTPVTFTVGVGQALSASEPDVVVGSEFGPLAVGARLWAGRRRIPYLLLSECTPASDVQLPAAQLRWHRHFARNVDGAIVVSSAGRERLLAFGVSPERITVALQAADLTPVRAAAARARGVPAFRGATAGPTGAREPQSATDTRRVDGSAPLRVLTVGRLVPDKNVGLLTRALAQAGTDLAPRRIALDVVGDGFLRAELAATAQELGLEVVFHGHLEAEALARQFARVDLFALVSRYEPFGVVLREAAAAGLPILATRVVGAAGDVARDGANAILVAPDDLSGTAVALGRILSDADLRGHMSAASLAIDADTANADAEPFICAVLGAAASRSSARCHDDCTPGHHRDGTVPSEQPSTFSRAEAPIQGTGADGTVTSRQPSGCRRG